MYGMKMTGLGIRLPRRLVTNEMVVEDLRRRREEVKARFGLSADDPRLQQFDTDLQWLSERTGTRDRYLADPSEATSDLGLGAAEAAVAQSGLPKEKIEFVVFATVTPDHHASPATAHIVQEKLGIRTREPGEFGKILRDVECFDLTKACCSFPALLQVAYALIRSDLYAAGLVIGADTNSRIVNPNDRGFFPLMGDVGTCVVVERTSLEKDQFGLKNFLGGSDGSLAELVQIPAGGSRLALTSEMLADPFDRRDTLRMDGGRVLKLMGRLIPEIIERALVKMGWKLKDIREIIHLLLLHQANDRITVVSMDKIGCLDLASRTIEKYGNTTSAGYLLAYADAIARGVLKDGDRCMMVGFGGGVGWNTVIFTHRAF